MKNKSNTVWGIILIILGLYFLSGVLGLQYLMPKNTFFLLIGTGGFIYGIIQLIRNKRDFITFLIFYSGFFFLGYVILINWTSFNLDIGSPWIFLVPSVLLAWGTTLLVKKDDDSMIL